MLTTKFQRIRLKCEKLTDDRQVMAKAHVAFDKASQKTTCGYLPKCQNFNKPAHPQKKSVDPLPQ
jgi:hypothetical protein